MGSLIKKHPVEGLALAISLLLLALACAPARAQTYVSGAVPGSFEVNRMGEANYRIPIRVLPGIARMEPRLALAYSSSAPNGPLGVRGGLEGPSEIRRCARTVAQDGAPAGVDYSMNDRYCMDGQRLVAVPDSVTGLTGVYGADKTEYRTEIESASKVVSYGTAGNGPQYFKVWQKDGRILEYGNTTDSRILADGKTTARVWALNRVSDRKTNYMDFTYISDANLGLGLTAKGSSYNLQFVKYRGNLTKSVLTDANVEFKYESRGDVEQGYEGGSLSSSQTRVKNIITRATIGGTIIRDYRLTYDTSGFTQRSRLKEVRECDLFNNCFNPTLIAYPSTGGGSLAAAPVADTSVASGQLLGPNVAAVYYGDFDGDGYTDILRAGTKPSDTNVTTGAGNILFYGKRTGAGFETGVAVLANETLAKSDGSIKAYIGDFDGDGKADVLVGASTGTTTPNLLWLGVSNRGEKTGDKYFGQKYSTAIGIILQGGSLGYRTHIADFNGDGRSDALVVNSTNWNAIFYGGPLGGLGGVPKVVMSGETLYALDGSIGSYIGDFNGDGMADVLRGHSDTTKNKIWYGTATGFSSGDTVLNGHYLQGTFTLTSVQTYIGDFNGDGKDDVLVGVCPYSGPELWYGTGAGAGTGEAGFKKYGAITAMGYLCASGGETTKSYIADFDRDGRADVLRSDSLGTFTGVSNEIYYGRGEGFSAFTLVLANKRLQNAVGTVITEARDFNGDGKADLFVIDTTTGNTWGLSYPYISLNSPPTSDDVATSIADGLGATTTIVTAPWPTSVTDPLPDYITFYPEVNVRLPISVVTSTTLAGGDTSLVTTYSYLDLMVHRQGRGLLGFGSKTEAIGTGATLVTTYRYKWPFTGIEKLRTHSSTTHSRSLAVDEVMCLDPASSTPTTALSESSCAEVDPVTYANKKKRAVPYVSKTTASGADSSSSVAKVVTTLSGYDVYGNVGKVNVVRSDPGNAAEVRTNDQSYVYYAADKANWFVDQVKTITDVRTTPADSYTY